MYNTMPEVAPIKCAVRESAVRTKKIIYLYLGISSENVVLKDFFTAHFIEAT